MKTDFLQYIIGICQGFIIICGALCYYKYYFGKIQFIKKIEQNRKRRIKKYGWLFKFTILLFLTSGLFIVYKNLIGIINS